MHLKRILHERNVDRVSQLCIRAADPFEKIDDPTYHGLARESHRLQSQLLMPSAFSARNVWIEAKDGSKLHGWHTLYVDLP